MKHNKNSYVAYTYSFIILMKLFVFFTHYEKDNCWGSKPGHKQSLEGIISGANVEPNHIYMDCGGCLLLSWEGVRVFIPECSKWSIHEVFLYPQGIYMRNKDECITKNTEGWCVWGLDESKIKIELTEQLFLTKSIFFIFPALYSSSSFSYAAFFS